MKSQMIDGPNIYSEKYEKGKIGHSIPQGLSHNKLLYL